MDCCSSRGDAKEGANGKKKLSPAQMRSQKASEESDKLADINAKLTSVKNRFVNSKRFKDMVQESFTQVDIDKSNTLDANEVYIAVLLLYLKISGVCKGAIPPDRHRIEELILKFDNPKNPGHLDYCHYEMFCQFLCSQIAGRVTVQMLLQMVVAPLLALLACDRWERFMNRVAPETYKYCASKVPPEVVVTLFVGIGVSLFVPPLMSLVDRYVLKEAKAAEAEIDAQTAKNKKGWFSAFKKKEA